MERVGPIVVQGRCERRKNEETWTRSGGPGEAFHSLRQVFVSGQNGTNDDVVAVQRVPRRRQRRRRGVLFVETDHGSSLAPGGPKIRSRSPIDGARGGRERHLPARCGVAVDVDVEDGAPAAKVTSQRLARYARRQLVHEHFRLLGLLVAHEPLRPTG